MGKPAARRRELVPGVVEREVALRVLQMRRRRRRWRRASLRRQATPAETVEGVETYIIDQDTQARRL